MARTEVASHRGGAFLWPENSLLAFRNALALPAEQLELDVHLSADGEVVVMHDHTLDRTTDASGPVRARSMAELRRARLRGTGGEGVPSLADAAALVRDAGKVLRLEIKAGGEGRPYPGVVPACLSVLDRLNRELGADFDVSAFRHRAVWNAEEERVEMHLEATRAQRARLGGKEIRFRAGETIHTENSHKYRPERLEALADAARWSARQTWTGPGRLFSVWLLEAR